MLALATYCISATDMSDSGVVEWGWQVFFLLVYEVVGGVVGITMRMS